MGPDVHGSTRPPARIVIGKNESGSACAKSSVVTGCQSLVAAIVIFQSSSGESLNSSSSGTPKCSGVGDEGCHEVVRRGLHRRAEPYGRKTGAASESATQEKPWLNASGMSAWVVWVIVIRSFSGRSPQGDAIGASASTVLTPMPIPAVSYQQSTRWSRWPIQTSLSDVAGPVAASDADHQQYGHTTDVAAERDTTE